MAAKDERPLLTGRVHVARSGFFEVETAEGRLTAKLRGRLKQGKWENDLVVVGDVVEVRPNDRGEASIESVAPRRSKFSRRHPVSRGREKEDVLAANLDVVLVAASASSPPLRPRLVDRFLVIAEWNRLAAVVVVTKIDEAEDRPAIEDLVHRYRAIGYVAVMTSAKTGEGLDVVADAIRDRTAAILGPSGAGKSTLVNALQPGLDLDVAALGEAGKGRHTTRAAVLLPVREGFVVDTPGIRELASFAIPPRELGSCFPDIDAAAGGCAYRDCIHVEEPDCAVRASVERGEIQRTRYETYLSLLRGDEA
jgi:ribosome biogenesis GTPase / thiamine phosphate phosphatase